MMCCAGRENDNQSALPAGFIPVAEKMESPKQTMSRRNLRKSFRSREDHHEMGTVKAVTAEEQDTDERRASLMDRLKKDNMTGHIDDVVLQDAASHIVVEPERKAKSKGTRRSLGGSGSFFRKGKAPSTNSTRRSLDSADLVNHGQKLLRMAEAKAERSPPPQTSSISKQGGPKRVSTKKTRRSGGVNVEALKEIAQGQGARSQ